MVIKHQVIRADMENIYARGIDWNRLCGKTILVTGAYGMVASYFVFFLAYLNEQYGMGIRILAQGRSVAKMKARFGEIATREYFTICQWNISEKIPELGTVHYLIHAASPANPRLYAVCPIEVAEPNTLGTYYLLEYAATHGTESFLFISSGDVYGNFGNDVYDITEESMGKVNPLDIHSCYSESKRMAETWCELFWHEKGTPIKIARLAHTYGPTMDVENDPRVFASFVKCVVNGQDIELFSDGSAKRPFSYIADAIAGMWLVLFYGKSGEAYNVCNSKEFMSIHSLAEKIAGLRPELGLKVIVKERERCDTYLENKDNQGNKMSEQKLIDLGWRCEFDTMQGFQRVLRYILEKGEQ